MPTAPRSSVGGGVGANGVAHPFVSVIGPATQGIGARPLSRLEGLLGRFKVGPSPTCCTF